MLKLLQVYNRVTSSHGEYQDMENSFKRALQCFHRLINIEEDSCNNISVRIELRFSRI